MNGAAVRYNALAAFGFGRRNSDPPMANMWNSEEAGDPVILLHGLGMDSATSWFTLAPLLANNGFRVFCLDVGRHGQGLIARPRGSEGGMPGVGEVELCADELEVFVDRVLAATGRAKVALVGHSFGGLLAQYYVLRRSGAGKVSHFVGLAPTVHGTTFNGLLRVQRFRRIGARLVGRNVLQQAAGSEFLQALYSDGETVEGIDYTTISPRWDVFTTPIAGQAIAGARNIRLRGLAGHILILFDRRALGHVVDALS